MVTLLVVSTILVVLVVAILLVVAVMVVVPIIAMDGHCWHLLLLDCEGHDIRHLNVHGADGRSKRTLHCSDYFHCVGSDFLGGVDSGFWLVAVVTWYCPDDGFLAFSWLLAARVFHSTQEDH